MPFDIPGCVGAIGPHLQSLFGCKFQCCFRHIAGDSLSFKRWRDFGMKHEEQFSFDHVNQHSLLVVTKVNFEAVLRNVVVHGVSLNFGSHRINA